MKVGCCDAQVGCHAPPRRDALPRPRFRSADDLRARRGARGGIAGELRRRRRPPARAHARRGLRLGHPQRARGAVVGAPQRPRARGAAAQGLRPRPRPRLRRRLRVPRHLALPAAHGLRRRRQNSKSQREPLPAHAEGAQRNKNPERLRRRGAARRRAPGPAALLLGRRRRRVRDAAARVPRAPRRRPPRRALPRRRQPPRRPVDPRAHRREGQRSNPPQLEGIRERRDRDIERARLRGRARLLGPERDPRRHIPGRPRLAARPRRRRLRLRAPQKGRVRRPASRGHRRGDFVDGADGPRRRHVLVERRAPRPRFDARGPEPGRPAAGRLAAVLRPRRPLELVDRRRRACVLRP